MSFTYPDNLLLNMWIAGDNDDQAITDEYILQITM